MSSSSPRNWIRSGRQRDKALILEQFLPVPDVSPSLFAGRSLYLLPDGPAAQHPYGVLVEAFQLAG